MLYDTVGLMLQERFISIPFFLIFFAAQLYLCFKVNSIKIKLVPEYIIIVVLILAGNVAIISGGLTAYVIPALLTSCVVTPGLIGVVLAWIVYEIYIKKHPK